jgi:hypothetical protein
MELSIAGQAMGLLCFAAYGLAMGLVYDLLRPMRYRGKGAFLLDLCFCALGAAACFMLSMESGKAGLWNIMCALLGFCLYIRHLSPMILPIFTGIFNKILAIPCQVNNTLKSFKFLKKILYK